MIHKYKIELNKGKCILAPPNEKNLILNTIYRVSWETEGEKYLEIIVIEIMGQEIHYEKEGVILASYPEIDSAAYNMSTFLANNILIQTSIEAFDPSNILANFPELIPETKKEEALLKSNKKRIRGKLTLINDLLGGFKPKDYMKYSPYPVAVAHFANGIRQHEPSIKFEHFYKVVEAIFEKGNNETAETFDKRVSDHISTIDNRFTKSNLKKLRRYRNRCVHPNAHLGHLSPEDLVAVRQIKSSLPDMQLLAKLSMDNPPT